MSTAASFLAPQLLLGGRSFDLIGPVVLDQTPDGYLEYQPHARYKGFGTEPLNPYGLGPFCRFKVAGVPHGSGLYAFVVDGVPTYVGRTLDLAGRLSPVNYGAISPKNCYRSGQSTNCKVNSRILEAARAGHRIALYVHRTPDLSLEREIIESVRPAWNGRAK